MNRIFLSMTIAVGAIVAPAFAQHQHANPPPVTTSKDEPQLTKQIDSAAVKPPPFLPLSPLARYQRFSLDEPLIDWLVANKTVRDIGGWREYAKESARVNQASALESQAGDGIEKKPSPHAAHVVPAGSAIPAIPAIKAEEKK